MNSIGSWYQRLVHSLSRTRLPWSPEVRAFWDRVAKSGLLDEDQLREAYAAINENRISEATLEDVGALLISTNVLTPWQCDKLRSGKWKGFFQEGHCLLGHLGKDETSAYYLCRHLETRRQMVMAVTPPTLSPDGKLRYDYYELADEEVAHFM